jgi:5-methyltetrahydrofolate--homocysteine methyltransferase
MAIKDVYEAVLSYNMVGIKEVVKQELEAGSPVEKLLSDGLISAMDEVGKRFSAGDIFVPEMLMAAKVMKEGLEIISPLLTSSETESIGTVVIGTVKGDLHDIGKNLVAMIMEGGGFKVVDLGVDVDSSTFVKAAADNGAKVVALSALLTTTMPAMRDTVAALREAGVSNIIVGGAPVTKDFASEIGAAGFSHDAPGAVTITRELLKAA